MPVDEIYQLFGRDHARLVDLFKEGMFSPALEITLPGSAVAPALVADIRETPCPGFAVWGIDVRDHASERKTALRWLNGWRVETVVFVSDH